MAVSSGPSSRVCALLTTCVINVVMSSSPAKRPVYLRGIPSSVIREAKAAAARRGITLAGFVADSLARALQDPMQDSEQIDDLSREMRWYERNRERLVREYAGEYVAILDNAVIDHDPDFEDLAERVFAREVGRNVFMPQVVANPRSLRVASPRVSRQQRQR
jgi:hypothetical protein